MKSDFITCANQFGTHRMAYVEWGAPSALPSIICVHGLTRNGRDFDWLAAALEQDGRHVICPDIVGRGKSDMLSAHPELYGYPQYIADITSLLKEKNLKEVAWVGTSMGGIIGMLMAAAPETAISRLVITMLALSFPSPPCNASRLTWP